MTAVNAVSWQSPDTTEILKEGFDVERDAKKCLETRSKQSAKRSLTTMGGNQ